VCPRCNNSRETILHALAECPAIRVSQDLLLSSVSSILGGARYLFELPGIDIPFSSLNKSVARAILAGGIATVTKLRLLDFFDKSLALKKARHLASAFRSHFHRVWQDRCFVSEVLPREERVEMDEWSSIQYLLDEFWDEESLSNVLWNEEALWDEEGLWI